REGGGGGRGAGGVMGGLSGVGVVGELFEADTVDIREGAAARVTSPSLPDQSLEGRVEMVPAVVDPARHTLPVRVRLANPDRLLRPNVYATVRFAPPPPKDAGEVKGSAPLPDGGRPYLCVPDGAGRRDRRE